MKAWLCLGSNQDKPKEQLERAVEFLNNKCYVKIVRKGNVHITKPFGHTDQPDFANQLLEINTVLSAEELLAFIKTTEVELGRKPTFRWGPRLIDIDIVFYGDETINREDLTIPHPGVKDRHYLLQLLNEAIPDYVHPELKHSISHLYKNLSKES
jgi:dihydroneopterin aldolase/2-amino-4-hydroxy-6-hydroxymethyldihydropteridine diphosphokinase